MKKLLALMTASAMAISMLATAAMAEEEESTEVEAEEEAYEYEIVDYGGITLTFMNSKPEISEEMEAIVDEWAEAHNVKIEFYETSTPGDTLTQKYASGDGPTIAIVDSGQIVEMGEEKMLPLDGEPWEDDTTLGWYEGGKLYGMPLTVESQCLVVNKAKIEEVLGHEFDKTQYTTTEAFEGLLAELRENGMENPMVLLSEKWSIAGHLFGQLMNFQDGTADGCYKFVDDIKEGKDCFENPMFKNLMEIFRIYTEYNINKDDPLAALYDLNCAYLVDGDAVIMSNGTWVWPDLAAMDADPEAFTIMSHPVDNEELTGRVYAGATKFMVVDNTVATEEQQAAAKDFLVYLTMTDEGRKALVEGCGIVSGFTTNPYAPADPVNTALAVDYMAKGLTVNTAPFGAPSDFASIITPYIQKLVDKTGTDRELADALNEYWAEHEPLGR